MPVKNIKKIEVWTTKVFEVSRITNDQSKNDSTYGAQYAVTLAVAFVFANIGLHFAWAGASLPILMDPKKSSLLITSSERAWIAGFIQIGSMIAPVIGFYICEKFGRKSALFFFALPNILSFIITYLTTKVWMLYAARFFSGSAVGLGFFVVPIYLSEISSPQIRGKLSNFVFFWLGVGNLLEYCIIPLLTIKDNALICLALAIGQAITLFFIPETPYYCIMKENIKDAEETLKFLRQNPSVTNELLQIINDWNIQKQDTANGNILDIFRTKLNRKCIGIVTLLSVAQQLSGIAAIITYIVNILHICDKQISIEVSAIFLALLFVLFFLLSLCIIDKFERRSLFIITTFASAVPLATIGLFYSLKSAKYDLIGKINLVPLFGLVVYQFTFSLGLATMPFVVANEIFPTKYKAMSNVFINSLNSIFALIITKLYQIISDKWGVQYNFYIFAFCCVVNAILGIFFLPETKNKTLEEIQIDLRKTINT